MVHQGDTPPAPPSKVVQLAFLAWVGLPLAVIGGGVAIEAITSGAVPIAGALLGAAAATTGQHYLFAHRKGHLLRFSLCSYILATLGFNYVRMGIDAATGEIKVLQVTTFNPEAVGVTPGEREGEDDATQDV